ncbi:MAG: gliding motility-associated C-terminal domain-containing protein [Taibaiella sp.]|nr:gliding motility-associated C-terminal domain-containing protein [Taibaiella sp.]
MKKCLLLIAILFVSQMNTLFAQSLFNSPDTVCVNQPVKLSSNIFNAKSYYWGFCSGFLFNTPLGTNMGDNFDFSIPTGVKIANDSGFFYGFVINSKTSELLRLNYGRSLDNTPTVTNLGNLTMGLPENPTSLYLVRDTFSRKWFLFVSGGFQNATSELARIDFGPRLSNNKPNIANFGNPAGLLDHPKGLFVAQDADNQWLGYVVNYNTGQLIRLDFSFNVSNTPLATDMGNPGGVLNFPSDLTAVYDANQWHLFITNFGNSTLARVDLGTALDTVTPVGSSLGDFLFRILKPSAISMVRDCNYFHLYITDSTTSQLVEVRMPTAAGPYTGISYSVTGGMNFPTGISNFLRDRDTVYAFITNAQDSTLTKISFNHCTNSTIPSFTEVAPPAYRYNTPGVYNIYYVVNEGLPNMQVDCRDITVLAPPTLYRNNDTTLCQGDTLRLYAVSTLADSIRWSAGHNIDTTNVFFDSVRVYPNYSTTYKYTLYYPFGCIVDTSININIVKVKADAGPDRYVRDGAISVLGGPFTSMGTYSYHWEPFQFLSDSTVPNPYANPPYDFTYYLTVTEQGEGYQCSSKDTVTVRITCGDFYLPNAFVPTSGNPVSSRFGILNNALIKLNFFRIYNRYGQLVFETTDPRQQWDGLFNGKLADEGVYVWHAEGFCSSGKQINKTGNVTLFH